MQEIRGVFKVCKLQLTKERYSSIRQYMYGFASGQLTHKQLLALCEVSYYTSRQWTTCVC